jgi:hypothetical protein
MPNTGRGTPHYHILLWFQGASYTNIEENPPEEIIAWINKKITCNVPDTEKSSELYRLV